MPVSTPLISPDVSSGPNRQSLAAFDGWMRLASEYLDSSGSASADDMRTAYESGWNAGRAALDLETFPDAQGGRIDAELTALRMHEGAGWLRKLVRKLRGNSLGIRAADWLVKQGLADKALLAEVSKPIECVEATNQKIEVPALKVPENSLGGGTDAGIPNGAQGSALPVNTDASQACGAD